MGQLQDQAKAVFANGPTSNPSKPPKAGVIGLFGMTESLLTSVIDGVVVGNAVVYATRAGLFGNLDRPANTLGVVYNDSNGPLNGIYIKSGASGSGSWSLTNLTLPSTFAADLTEVVAEVADARGDEDTLVERIGALVASIETKADATTVASQNVSVSRRINAPLALARHIIVDLTDRIGGGAAVYIPRSITFRNATDGVLFDISLTADAKLADWCKVVVAPTTAALTIYLDAQTSTVMVAVSGVNEMPIDANRYFHLLTLWGGNTGTFGVTSLYEVENTAGTGTQFAGASASMSFDRTLFKLYVPTIYGYYKGGFSWTLSPLSTDNNYREVSLPTSGALYHVWLNVWDIIANGPASATAIHVTQGFAATPRVNDRGDGGLILLGSGNGRWFAPASGLDLADVVPNQFGCGKQDNDLAELVSEFNEPTALTDSTSLSLGFVRGFRDTRGANGRPYYGGYFPQPRNSGVVLYRYLIESDTDEAFGTPHAYLWKRESDGTITRAIRNPVLVKKHSARVREYMEFANLSDGGTYIGIWCGSHLTTESVRVFGVQFWCGSTSNPWISVTDFPRAADETGRRMRGFEGAVGNAALPIDAVIPEKLWMIAERRYPLYLDQMVRNPVEGRLRATVMPLTISNSVPPKATQFPGGSVVLDTPAPGANVRIALHDRGGPNDKHVWRDVNVVVKTLADLSSLGPLRAHFLGDSLFNSTGVAVNTLRRMQAMGLSVSAIGTRIMNSTVPGDGTFLGEGRSGKEFADYIYEKTDVLSPVATATYTAATDAEKANYNPYLRAATGGDPSNLVFNGQTFDFRYYLDRFAFQDPHVVGINLGTNDMSRNTSSVAMQRLINGLRVLVTRIRAACPTALIVLFFNPYGRSADDARWTGNQWDGLKVFQKFIRDQGDSRVILIPAYCGVSRDLGFQSATTVAADTGMETAATSDATHYSPWGIAQVGEMAAQMIAAKLVD